MTDDREETEVVTVFLRNDADVLLLCRSAEVGSYEGKWGAVAGHAEGDPDAAAREEIREETGLDPDGDATLVRRGDPFDVVDDDLGKRWVVHSYLFDCANRDVASNYETTASEWVPPTEILRRETVPDLWTSYDRVRPTVETVATDREHGSAHLSVRALEVLRDEAALAAESPARADADGAERSEASAWVPLAATARELRAARPAMPVVANRVNRAMAAASEGGDRDGSGGVGADTKPRTPRALERAASESIDRALAADDEAARAAAERLPDRVATLSRSGTVFAALERADPDAVLVAESRPGREGVGVAEHLARATDADVTITTDAAFADRLAATGVDAVVVGADALGPDGSVLNKAGTRGAAAAAASEGVDCFVVAARDKVATTDALDREERDPAEVYDGDAPLAVANPTFDVTPPALVDAVVTEAGVLDAAGVRAVAEELRATADWE